MFNTIPVCSHVYVCKCVCVPDCIAALNVGEGRVAHCFDSHVFPVSRRGWWDWGSLVPTDPLLLLVPGVLFWSCEDGLNRGGFKGWVLHPDCWVGESYTPSNLTSSNGRTLKKIFLMKKRYENMCTRVFGVSRTNAVRKKVVLEQIRKMIERTKRNVARSGLSLMNIILHFQPTSQPRINYPYKSDRFFSGIYFLTDSFCLVFVVEYCFLVESLYFPRDLVFS